MAEIRDCSPEPEAMCEKKALNNNKTSDASETTSSSSTQKLQDKGKRVMCKRRNPRVPVRRTKANVAAIGLPLGMSFAAVMAQVLYRRDAAAERISPSHLSLMCTSAIKESLASVYGDRLDGLTRNFEQSFSSTLSTLQSVYESSTSNEGNKFKNMTREIPGSKLTLDRGDCSSDVARKDDHLGSVSRAESQDQSISCEEVWDNFPMDSISRDLTLHGQSNQMVCLNPSSSGPVINNPSVSNFEKAIVEQCRSNDLKTIELSLTMRKLKFKETELALYSDMNNLERSKLAMGISKASFKAEKFKNQLEDTRHAELSKKCIDCLIAGLIIMSASLLYATYVHSYDRITEATESCIPSTQESSSWWAPKAVSSFNSTMHILWCQVQAMIRFVCGVLMIFAVSYLLFLRSSTSSSQTMPITFILLMLGIGCGFCGKMCVDTLGGSGYVWLLYWEALCLLHFLSIALTSTLYPILHGPVMALQKKDSTIFQYWLRRCLFYATLLVFLPLSCGLIPFASFGQWTDHFLSKVSDSIGSEW